MVVRFMSHTPYAGLEEEMQHIPGFRPRRSGMVVSHLPDDPKRQDGLCGHISDECTPFHELLEVLAKEVAVSPFVRRVNRLTGMKEPCFSGMVTENGFLSCWGDVSTRYRIRHCVRLYIFFLRIGFYGEERCMQWIGIRSSFQRFTFMVWIWMVMSCFTWQGICIGEASISACLS